MDGTPYDVWILTLLLLLILIVIFSLTTYFVKRSCLKQLSNNYQQRPVLANNRHRQSTMKRGVLIIQIGMLEICVGLVVAMEATAAKFNIIRSLQTGESSTHCSVHYQCAGQFHYISFAIVCCLVLSIVRCLAQRFVLERLSKSDVVSMTRIYLAPATCLVTVLCVWSWFRLYEDRERKQSDMTIVCCRHANQTVPLNSFLLILLPIFWNLLIDYSDYRKGKTGFIISTRVPSQRRAKYDSVKHDSISMKQTNLILEIVLSQGHPNHIPSKTTDSMSSYDNEVTNTKPAISATTTLPVVHPAIPATTTLPVVHPVISANTTLPVVNPVISANTTLPVLHVHSEPSDGSNTVQLFTNKTAEPTFLDSLCDFLNIYARLYLALIIYLAVLISVYAFLANCCAHYGSADFTTAVFMTMLVMTGILRAIQVFAAEVENRDELKCEKIGQTLIDV